jgi:hypothetical protein
MMATGGASGLLVVGQPLLFTKELALKTGVHMAVFLQQTHFMVNRYGKEDDEGIKWLRWSHEKWHKKVFPFWAERTLRTILYEATHRGWVIVKKEAGATAQYTFNYPKFEADLLGSRLAEIATPKKGSRVAEIANPQGGRNCQPQGGRNCQPAADIERELPEEKEKKEKSGKPLFSPRVLRTRGLSGSSPKPSQQLGRVSGKLKTAEEYKSGAKQKHGKTVVEKVKVSERPTTEKVIQLWRMLLSEYDLSTLTVSFTGQERGIIRSMVKRFEDHGGGQALFNFLKFSIAHWEELRNKIVWQGKRATSKLPETPSIKEIYFNREDILRLMTNPEDVKTAKQKAKIYTDVSQVPKNHPHYTLLIGKIKRDGKAEVQS